jgi:hypothetical protein
VKNYVSITTRNAILHPDPGLKVRGLTSKFQVPSSKQNICFLFCRPPPFSVPCHTNQPRIFNRGQLVLSFRLRRGTASRPPKLPLVLPAHLDLISRPLPTFPKPSRPLLTHHSPMTKPTIFGPVVLLPTTPPANYSIGPFVWMFLAFIMTFVTSIDFLTATEAEPSVTLGVVSAAASFWKLGAGR